MKMSKFSRTEALFFFLGILQGRGVYRVITITQPKQTEWRMEYSIQFNLQIYSSCENVYSAVRTVTENYV